MRTAGRSGVLGVVFATLLLQVFSAGAQEPWRNALARPVALAPGEAAELGQLERLGMTEKEKATWDKWCDKVMRCAVAGRKMDAAEAASLAATEDPSLEKTVALGSRSVGKTFALYVPNVILDALDCFSGAIGLGLALGGEIHFTRYVSLGLGAWASVLNVHWYFNRNLAFSLYDVGAIAAFGPFRAFVKNLYGWGTRWKDGRPSGGVVTLKKGGLFRRSDRAVTQGYSDPWAIGFGWNAELHPVEVADFFTGLITFTFVDISRDDLGNPARKAVKRYMVGR